MELFRSRCVWGVCVLSVCVFSCAKLRCYVSGCWVICVVNVYVYEYLWARLAGTLVQDADGEQEGEDSSLQAVVCF